MPDELTQEEQQYFDSRGESSLGGDEPEAVAEPEVEPAPEPEAVQEAAPEEVPADDTADVVEKIEEEPKVVPLQALHEAREDAKKLRERLESRDADFNKLAGRLDVLQQMAEKEQTQQFNWDEEPIDAGKQVTQELQALKARQEQQDQIRQLQQTVVAQEQAFRQQKPDYDQAIRYLQEVRTKELGVFGLQPGEIQAQIAREAQDLATMALQNNRNPAEYAYQLAEVRGYSAAPAEEAKAAPAPAADPAEKLTTIERGQKAALSATQATAAPQPRTNLEAIMNMDDYEFAQIAENDWRKLWQ